MTLNNFRKFRIAITFFVALTVGIAVSINNLFLALAGIVAGMIFMFLVKKRVRGVLVDERIIKISNQAARITYGVVTMVLALASLIFIVIGQSSNEYYLQSLGIIFSYVTLFSVAIYSISYKFLSKKYGDD